MKNPGHVALKEWAVVCRALEEGRQLLLFRKGGIREKGRDFTVEETEFFLFPTFEHQHAQALREEFRPWLEGLVKKTPETLPIRLYATVEKVLHLPNPGIASALNPCHIYSERQLLERFRYKPNKPLYVLLLRAYRIPTVQVPNLPAYAGCVSWVHLGSPLSTQEAAPVLSDESFRRKAEEIERTIATETMTLSGES